MADEESARPWVWISSRGDRLADPPAPPFVIAHGAHHGGRPTMVELDGQQLRVTGVFDCWGVHDDGLSFHGEAWGLVLDDGRQVIILRDLLHKAWWLARA